MLARALHAARRRQRCVVNLLDQKLWNPNPDYLSYTLSKAALAEPPPRCWRRRWRRGCGCAAWRRASRCCRATMSEAEFDAAHRLTPLQRSSTPEDVARAVRFLLESPAITGTTLLVDGGQHLQAPAARRAVPGPRQLAADPKA